MRTTLKRGFGRTVEPENGAGGSLSEKLVSLYRQPPAASRSIRNWAGRVLLSLVLALVALAAGIGGGLVLWFHESLISVSSNIPGIQSAEKSLDIPQAGKPVIALVLGDNIRAGFQASAGGRSDTIMLVRADPKTHTISLLSLPRDLHVPVYCKNTTNLYAVTRIDYAFAYCGAQGSLNTVKVLTGLKINYLITVDFNGFKKIVNDLGGIWLNIDRSYYNKNVGTPETDYANIDLQPGYQLLSGGSALSFVRFRHTDSDFYRQARQQEFIEALKDQITQHFNPLGLVRVVNDLVQNIAVAPAHLSDTTVLSYALFAIGLPAGHIVQNYISDTAVQSLVVDDQDELTASPRTIAEAVSAFTHPNLAIAAAANKAALDLKTKKVKPKPKHKLKPAVLTPAPDHTKITVLNGNGIAGSAANAAYLLAQRGYVSVLPAHGAEANAPKQNYFDTAIYYYAGHPEAQAAAKALSELVAPATVAPLPDDTALRTLDPGSMLLIVVGETFHNVLTSPTVTAPTTTVPTTPVFHHQPASVAYEPSLTEPLLAPLVHRVPFTLDYPSVLDASSLPDQEPGDVPVRLYTIVPGHKAVVLVFHTADGLAFWDIEETDWTGAPILQGKSFTHVLDGRTYQLYYAGQNLHMIVLHEGNTSYWVVNSLLNELSNETMIAIAKGLKPMHGH